MPFGETMPGEIANPLQRKNEALRNWDSFGIMLHAEGDHVETPRDAKGRPLEVPYSGYSKVPTQKPKARRRRVRCRSLIRARWVQQRVVGVARRRIAIILRSGMVRRRGMEVVEARRTRPHLADGASRYHR